MALRCLVSMTVLVDRHVLWMAALLLPILKWGKLPFLVSSWCKMLGFPSVPHAGLLRRPLLLFCDPPQRFLLM